MARIRSCHPGQWTDDSFVSCSPLARLLALGLRNEADDNGIFEWNPTKMKMRILPADNCEIPVLLAELVESSQVLKFTVAGRHFGIIRSFQRFQKPKKPSFQYTPPSEPLPDGYALSQAYFPTSSPPVPHSSRKVDSEGEEEGKGEKKTTSSSSSGADNSRERSEPPPPAAAPPADVIAALESLCSQHRVRLDARAKAHVAQWAGEGVTSELFGDAIRIARERKPDPELLFVRYLAPIVSDLRAGTIAAARDAKAVIAATIERLKDEPEWWESAEGVQQAGASRGIRPERGEDFWDGYAPRVFEAMGPGPWQSSRVGNVSHA